MIDKVDIMAQDIVMSTTSTINNIEDLNTRLYNDQIKIKAAIQDTQDKIERADTNIKIHQASNQKIQQTLKLQSNLSGGDIASLTPDSVD